MKLISKLSTSATALVVSGAALVMAFGGSASADCFQYNANGFNTSTTPVFNNICGVPDLGNESDFVRIRPDTDPNSDPNHVNDEDNADNPNYTVGTLTSACSNGDLFDIWNYLHNNATTNNNPDVNPSDPSAVAKDVQEALTATFGTNSTFTFGDTITASNASNSGISDKAVLDCGSTQVQLSLVPGSIHMYSQAYDNASGGWVNLPDGTVNGGPTTVGATNAGTSSATSGEEWGCWNYRILIVYQVETTTVPTPPSVTPATCNLLNLEATNQVAEIEKLTYTPNNATVTGATVVFTNASNNQTYTANLTLAELQAINNGTPYNFSVATAGNYSAKATVLTTLNGQENDVTSTDCVTTASITTPTTPTTPKTTPPTQLVNTGPGSVVGIFAAASALGAGVYRWFLGRRLHRS